MRPSELFLETYLENQLRNDWLGISNQAVPTRGPISGSNRFLPQFEECAYNRNYKAFVESDKTERSLRQKYAGRGIALMEERPKYIQAEHGCPDR
jgi:hypothetical protein